MNHEDELVQVLCKPCPYCGTQGYLVVRISDYEKYQAGAFVQDAFPDASAEARELLISGTCPRCWDLYIKPLDEEE